MAILHVPLEREGRLSPAFVEDGAVGIDAGNDMPLEVSRCETVMPLGKKPNEGGDRHPSDRLVAVGKADDENLEFSIAAAKMMNRRAPTAPSGGFHRQPKRAPAHLFHQFLQGAHRTESLEMAQGAKYLVHGDGQAMPLDIMS
jgi:hypothetical protein